jgi:hypothetical protein
MAGPPGGVRNEEESEVSDADEEIEFEIKRLPSARFQAKLHLLRRGRWWPPEAMICASEQEAMGWINGRLAIRGFEEAYDVDRVFRAGTGGNRD